MRRLQRVPRDLRGDTPGERAILAALAYDGVIAQSRRDGSPMVFALISQRRSQLHYLHGAIPDAIADAQAAIDAGRHFGPSLVAPMLYGPLMDALLGAGDTCVSRLTAADTRRRDTCSY